MNIPHYILEERAELVPDRLLAFQICFDAGGRLQFSEGAADVHFYGVDADVEFAGNQFIRQALSTAIEHFGLPGGEVVHIMAGHMISLVGMTIAENEVDLPYIHLGNTQRGVY